MQRPAALIVRPAARYAVVDAPTPEAALETSESRLAAADPVEAWALSSPWLSAFSAVVRSDSPWLAALVTPPIARDAAPAAATCGSCIAVREPSVDGANWLEALEGAALEVWAPDAPPPGKLCPVEKAPAVELAEFADDDVWLESSAWRADNAWEALEVAGLINSASFAGKPRTAWTAPSPGAPRAAVSQAPGHARLEERADPRGGR